MKKSPKNLSSKFKYFLFISFGFLNCLLYSQQQGTPLNSFSRTKTFSSQNDIFGTRNFIENKGQFENPVNKREKVLFLYEYGGEKVYFTSKGLVYEFAQHFPLTEEEREEQEEGKNITQKPSVFYYVNMNWLNQNPDIEIKAAEKQGHYFTYGPATLNSYAFKKITYKNVYKNIDVEYIIPQDKDHGIKYSFILHEGANADDIKINYTGDVEKIKQNAKGEIIVKTPIDDIVEHLPYSYYSDHQTVASAFNLQKDIIGFNFPAGHQENRLLVIDPWVTAVTTLTTNNIVFDVDYDVNDNVFIFGSYGYAKVAMFNSAGILQWTFSGTMAAPAWNSQIGNPMGSSVGSFVVDKFSGKAYVGQGANYPQVIRLDIAGNYDNYITPVNNLYQELWDMGFHCATGEMFILGGGHTSNTSAATINTLTPSLVLSTFQPANTAFVHDISTHCADDLGNVFVYYACSNQPLNHKICSVNPTFNGDIWTMPSNYAVLAEINNKSNYGGGSIPSAGYNGLSVNNNYLYYYDGLNLAAYYKATGAFIAATTTSLLPKRVGGIAADECDNIYVGGNGSIFTYSFNGTSFSTLTPIPLGVSTPTQNVIDIKFNRNNKTLYVAGTGFVGTYPANLSTNCLNFSLAVSVSNATVCPGQTVTLTAIGGTSYTWTNNGSTLTTVVVTPTANTSYTVAATRTTACGSSTDIVVKTVSVLAAPIVTVTGPKLVCKGKTGTLTASGANTYTWNNGVVSPTLAISPTTNTSYTVSGTSTAFGCSSNKAIITVSFSTCAGLEDDIEEHQMAKIYPNPVKDKLNIELIDPSGNKIDLAIYNALGQLVYSSEKLNFYDGRISTIDVGNIPKGLYVIILHDGGLKQSFRLIRE